MPTYILLSNLTDEGAKTIKRNPRRIKEVNTELEKLGVKVLAQYAVLGPYDFVNIVEAADNTAVARMSAALTAQAATNAQAIGAGHVFLILLGNAFPINVLNAVKAVPEVCRIFCATANPVEALVGATEQGRGVLGVIDGMGA